MKKIALAAVAVLLVGGFFYYSEKPQNAFTQPHNTIVVTGPEESELPVLSLIKADGSKVVARNLKGKIVLVLFQPSCDHCQREAVEIRKNLSAFAGYQVYFVSDAALPLLTHFAQFYQLAGKENVYFATTTIEEILNTVGPVEAPSLFIYSESGKLVKSFIGETPIEEILRYL